MNARVRLGLMMVVVGGIASASARGQSLYERPAASASVERSTPAPARADSTGAPPLSEVSLLAVEAPKPRQFQENDLITIIVSERSLLDRKLETDNEKTYDQNIAFTKFLDVIALLGQRVEPTSAERLPQVAIKVDNSFEGDSQTKQQDKLTDRLTARVLEAKPNGTLVLEARRSWTTDEDLTVITLSGICRGEDVTDKNTVQSNQMFDVTMNVQNSGEMRRTNKKGIIPRVLETIFNF